jgi:membrane protease YdiL (CAAX protease family)
MRGSELRVALMVEFLVLFVALPLGYRFAPIRIPALPVLRVIALYAAWQLMRDARFDRGRMWNIGTLPGRLWVILAIFAVVAVVIWLGGRWFAPQLQWNFVRNNPVFWAIVMVAYPVLSVYPQGIIYRAFFFERYGAFFPSRWVMIVASAAAFAFMHLIFRNWLAVGLTFAGGMLFAWRYGGDGIAGYVEL